MSIREIIWLVLIGVLLAVCLFLGIQSCSKSKVINTVTLERDSCRNAPKTTDTVHDSIPVYDTTWIRLKGKTIYIHDTVVKWCQSFFDSTYKFTTKSGNGRIHYRINVKDCEASIQFPEIVSPKEIITITNHIDTCISKPPEYKAKLFHWGLYTDLSANNFKSFPMIGVGGQMIINDQVTIGLGGAYMDKFYGNVRIGILFKK